MKNKEEGKLGANDNSNAAAHMSEENKAYSATATVTNSDSSIDTSSTLSSNSTRIQTLLVSAMNLVQDNDVLRDHIVDGINVIAEV